MSEANFWANMALLFFISGAIWNLGHHLGRIVDELKRTNDILEERDL